MLRSSGPVGLSRDKEGLDFYRNILRDASAVRPKCAEFDSVKSGMVSAAMAPVPGGVSLNVYWVLAAAVRTTHRPWDSDLQRRGGNDGRGDYR